VLGGFVLSLFTLKAPVCYVPVDLKYQKRQIFRNKKNIVEISWNTLQGDHFF
jgi:hypothetical protein